MIWFQCSATKTPAISFFFIKTHTSHFIRNISLFGFRSQFYAARLRTPRVCKSMQSTWNIMTSYDIWQNDGGNLIAFPIFCEIQIYVSTSGILQNVLHCRLKCSRFIFQESLPKTLFSLRILSILRTYLYKFGRTIGYPRTFRIS